jgi:hypothetical protein
MLGENTLGGTSVSSTSESVKNSDFYIFRQGLGVFFFAENIYYTHL